MLLLTEKMELVFFEPTRPRKPRHESPLDKVVFPLRDRGLVGTCTNSNCLCYNSFTGHGQMLRIVGLALGTGWGVLPYSFLSIKPRNSVIWGGSGRHRRRYGQ